MPISRLNKKNPRTLKIHHEAAASCRRVLNIHSSMNSWPLYHFSTIISFPCCFYRAEWKAKIDIFTTLKKHTLHHFLCRTSLFFSFLMHFFLFSSCTTECVAMRLARQHVKLSLLKQNQTLKS